MSNNKKDKLEEFFDTRIKKQTGTEGWNLPSDDVFLAAMETLDAEKEEEKTRWLIYAFTALTVIALSIFVFYKVSLNGSDEVVKVEARNNFVSQEVIENNIETVKIEAKEEIQETVVTKVDVQSVQNNKTVNTIPSQTKVKETKTHNSNNTIAQSNTTNSSSQNLNISNNIATQNGAAIQKEDKAIIHRIESATANRMSVNELSLLGNTSIQILEEREVAIPESKLVEPKLLSMSTQKPITLFAQGSLFQSSIFMKDIGNNDFTLEGYERFSTGFTLGLGIQKSLNGKFKLEAMTNWVHFSNTSLYTSHFTYDKTHESLAQNGEIMYHHEMVISTPRATIAMSDDVVMDKEMDHMDLIKNKTEIRESYDVVQLGIGLRYQILSKGKFDIDLGVLPAVNYIFNNRTGLNTVLEANNIEMAAYESSSDAFDIGGFNQFYFNLQGSINVNYVLSKNWKLNVSGLYGQSLNSLKEFNSQDLSKSYFKSRAIALGLAYQF